MVCARYISTESTVEIYIYIYIYIERERYILCPCSLNLCFTTKDVQHHHTYTYANINNLKSSFILRDHVKNGESKLFIFIDFSTN